MNTKSNFKAEATETIRRAISFLALNVFADEGEGNDPTPATGGASSTGTSPATPSLNFEELIKTARQEEKDKLYPQISSLKEKVKVLTESNNEALLKCAEWKQKYEAEVAKQNSGEKSEEVKNLETEIATLKAENEELKKNTLDEATLRAQIEAEFTVKNHLEKVKEQNKDTVLSVFMDEITGSTVEEIDQSLQKAIDKSNSVREQVTGTVNNPTSNTPANTPISNPSTGTSNVPPKAPPIANPSGGSTMPKNFDPEYVRGLQPGTPEYEEFRKSLGLH